MKKSNNYFVHFAPLLHQQGCYLPELPLDFPLSSKSFLSMTREPTYITNMLEEIQLKLEYLSKPERKVADIILTSPEQTIHSSVTALAVEANVSKPTVDHFCRSVDTRGFPNFRLHLIQGLTNGTPYVNYNMGGDDSVESYTGKIFESAMASLDHTRQSLNNVAVDRAVDLLTQTKKIAFFDLGSSATTVHDAINKFFHFNILVIYSDDIILQHMSCMNCNDNDVVMFIFHTGRTKSLAELTQLTRENDVTAIVLISPGMPLAHKATLAITLDVPGDTDIYMPVVFRLAQLTVIDALATGFTLRRGARFRDNLKRVKETLKESHFDKELLIKSNGR